MHNYILGNKQYSKINTDTTAQYTYCHTTISPTQSVVMLGSQVR